MLRRARALMAVGESLANEEKGRLALVAAASRRGSRSVEFSTGQLARFAIRWTNRSNPNEATCAFQSRSLGTSPVFFRAGIGDKTHWGSLCEQKWIISRMWQLDYGLNAGMIMGKIGG